MSVKKILIVEDSEDTQMLFRKALEMEAYEIEMAGTAREALAHLESALLPKLVLMDLSLPDMNGAELLKIIRQDSRWSHLKVIVVSGWDNLKARAIEIGADGFIRKPCDLTRLYDEVGRFFQA